MAKHVDTDASGSIDTSEYYVYDGEDVLWDFVDADGEQSGDPVIDKRYLHGPATDQILAVEDYDADEVLWYLADNLGTVRDLAEAVTDGAGDVTDVVIDEHFSYDSFGNVLSGDTSKTRYLYTGREFDTDTGLQYNRARWYDPATGNWLSEDPIGFTAGDTNLTRYVGNNVTNATDPSGLANWMTPSALPGSGISPEVDRQVERTKTAAAVNGFAQTVQSTFSFGFYSNVRLMDPTNDPHYGGMELSYRVTFEAMFGFGAGKLASAPGWIGKAAGLTNVAGDVTATGRGIANGDPVEGIAGAAGLGGAGLGRLAGRTDDAAKACRKADASGTEVAAKEGVWPTTAKEMDDFLGVPGEKIPDGPTTPGRNKTVWRPNKDTKITHEAHPYHPDAPDWHKNPHWHLDTPNNPHQRFLPGDELPGTGE